MKDQSSVFRVGEWVYADDWCYGRIVSIDGDEAFVEFETDRGGGSFAFKLCELRHAPKPRKRRIKR